MQSRQTPAYFRRFAQVQRVRDPALGAGLWIYFCLCCVVIGGCAVGFYKLMQPIVYPNPGAPAYSSTTPPAPAVEPASGGQSAFAIAIEPEGKPSGGETKDIGKAKKSEIATLSLDTKRKRPAQSKKHDPKTDYAAQTAFGYYQPWGSYQTRNGYRPYSNSQPSSGYRPWNSYQGWGGYRNGH